MSKRLQIGCAWCGPVFAVVFFAGMLCAGLLPPPSPHDTTAEVARFWRDHPDLTRLGLWLMLVAGGLTAPFGAQLCVTLRRIERGESPMSFLQAIGAACGVMAILVPTMIFMAASFRPERSPELVKLLNDLAWIPFVINFPPAMIQCLSISGAVFANPDQQVLPRWIGYFNAWTAFLFIPGGLIIFFKHGPFAWNGLLAFWLAAVVFGTWFIVMTVAMVRAVRRSAPGAAALEPVAVA
jgi:hypothetical protein